MTGETLADQVIAGDVGALARAITILENRTSGYRELAGQLHRVDRQARTIGITGSPGTGKSTLVNQLITAYRDRDLTVGVVGVDPTSPFSGGAILGDRVRMDAARGDSGVFIRSLSTRGALGGLSPAVDDVLTAYEAFGMDRLLVETVGTGQNEVDIVRATDTVAVVVQPGHGDDVQLLKAGIAEIADVFVVNKADLDHADRTIQQLTQMISESSSLESGTNTWEPPIVETVAIEGDGIDGLLDQIDNHRRHLEKTDGLEARRRDRYAGQLRRIIQADLTRRIQADLETDAAGLLGAVVRRECDPYDAADELLDRVTVRESGTR